MDTERRISGELPVLDLPTDRPRPAQKRYRGATHSLALPSELTAALHTLGRQAESTLDIALLAGFQALLYRYANQTDLMVGLPIADQALIQVVRCDLSGGPGFRELLGQVRESVMAAQAHPAVPVEQLADVLRVAFALQDSPSAPPALSALGLDLTLSLAECEAGLVGELTYDANLFDAATMERLAGHFQRLMASAVANPEQPIDSLNLLPEGERHQLLVGWNETAVCYPDTMLIYELVAARAAETPDGVAVVLGEERLTYGELDRRANQLAAYLRRIGLGPDRLVGVCLERSPAMLVALLGALKAGAAYVAIDPSYPRERIAYMLADAQVGVLLTREGLRRQMPDQGSPLFCLDTDWMAVAEESPAAPSPRASAANLAYIIYTSGSTGRPKGVMIEHRSLLNLVSWYQRTVGLTAGDRTTQTAGVAFDAAVVEIWPSLAAGATLYLPDEETRLSPPRLRDWLVSNQITVGFLATPLAEQVLPLDWPAHTALRFLLTGGEKLKTYPPAGLPFQLIDAYGPAEATVVTTLAYVPTQAGQKVAPAIGRPIANARIYLLDRLLQPVPVGVIGELYIGGSGLARGYLNQPGLTAERFLETEYGRLYKTGDMARYRPDGSLEFAGRSDFQVKIRGFRIELGEIETMLKLADGVRGAVVTAWEGASGGKQLVAYVVPEEGRPLKAETLRAFLKQQLPDYMVPAAFVLLDELPLTPNGKVDRRALPAPELPAEEYVAPRTPLEEVLADIWRAVLGVKRVGIHDSFFALGGHSLLATRITAQICTALGVDLKAASLFAAPTVAELAVVVDQARQEAGDRQIPPLVAVTRDRPLPLSFAQQRL
ncbi:MAG: non-ribosomal peptide synthetase, partial [Mycobacterium leprae]